MKPHMAATKATTADRAVVGNLEAPQTSKRSKRSKRY